MMNEPGPTSPALTAKLYTTRERAMRQTAQLSRQRGSSNGDWHTKHRSKAHWSLYAQVSLEEKAYNDAEDGKCHDQNNRTPLHMLFAAQARTSAKRAIASGLHRASQYARMAKQPHEHWNKSPASLHYPAHKAAIVEMRAPRTLRLAHNRIFIKTCRNEAEGKRERRRDIVHRNPEISKGAHQARKRTGKLRTVIRERDRKRGQRKNHDACCIEKAGTYAVGNLGDDGTRKNECKRSNACGHTAQRDSKV